MTPADTKDAATRWRKPYRYAQRLTDTAPLTRGWVWGRNGAEALDALGACHYGQVFAPLPWPLSNLW